MILPDVNILIYAYREGAPDHAAHREWLAGAVGGDASFAMSDVVLSGFLRLVTNARVFNPTVPLADALQFVNALRGQPNCVQVVPGPGHWAIFERLCPAAHAKGNLIPDAFLAALAIENGCELITADRDFARFPGLRWRHPLV